MNDKALKKMFNSSQWPLIDFSLAEVSQQAQKLAGKLSISGIQPKLSVKLDKKQNLLIPVAEGGEYILKPQTNTFPCIPENEQCCMDIAEQLAIDIPPHCLIPLKDHSLAYVIRRFDREKGIKIHQEDFTQILGKKDKYNGSAEQIGRRLKEISVAPGYDAQLFFERVVLNFILGNGDAHLKNYSVSHRDGENIRLTPAYDIVCSKIVIPVEEDSAISINGKKDKLRKKDFEELADYLDIPPKVRYEKFEKKYDIVKQIIESSRIIGENQRQFTAIVKKRICRLELSE